MRDARVDDMTRTLQDRLLEYGPDQLGLLIQVMRERAPGSPLRAAWVD
jgi:hypothetical protein